MAKGQRDMEPNVKTAPSFLWLLFGKVVLLAATIVLVWVLYAYLHAFRLDWLGWFYSKLLPLTTGLYVLVDNYFPADMKYKIRGAITDDLGQRSLFLLLLTAVVEQSWLHSFGRCDRWNVCLTARTVVCAN